jgi:hypothetical protein
MMRRMLRSESTEEVGSVGTSVDSGEVQAQTARKSARTLFRY